MLKNQPTNLLGTPSHPLHPGPTPAGVGQPAGYAPLPPLPATRPPTDALLTVRPDRVRPDRAAQNVVSLTKALQRAIPALKAGAPVDLVAPPKRGGQWFLDTRPTAVRRVEKTTPRFLIPALSREHFLIPAAQPYAPGAGRTQPREGGTAGLRPLLLFALGRQVPDHPGYYELHPVRSHSAVRPTPPACPPVGLGRAPKHKPEKAPPLPMAPVEKRACELCGTLFKPLTPASKYCGQPCLHRARQLSINTEEAYAAYASGLTLEEVAAPLEVSVPTLRRCLIEAGYKIREAGHNLRKGYGHSSGTPQR